MIWKQFTIAAFLLAVGSGRMLPRATRCPEPTYVTLADPTLGPAHRSKPREEYKGLYFIGVVQAVTADSLTVQGLDSVHIGDAKKLPQTKWAETTYVGNPLTFQIADGPRLAGVKLVGNREQGYYVLTDSNGKQTMIRRADQPPRKLIAHGALAAGKLPERELSYCLSDVKVGDHVQIDYTRVGGTYFLDRVGIARRPGGRVPPAPWEDEWKKQGLLLPTYRRNHESLNAYQDWEEKGIPLPYEYHPGGPWPQLAPPPREVKR